MTSSHGVRLEVTAHPGDRLLNNRKNRSKTTSDEDKADPINKCVEKVWLGNKKFATVYILDVMTKERYAKYVCWIKRDYQR